MAMDHKPKRQSSFNAGNGVSHGSKLGNGHSTLTKSNNVAINNTPKVLSKPTFSDTETGTLRKHQLNNTRQTRIMIDDDHEKF
jgi:hypothetical protein